MKTILELRRERESRTPIRKMITHLSHYYSDGGDTAISVKLVEEVVDKLNIDWYNPHLKILDVKSNKATFSLIIIEKLLSCGHDIDHILDNMIYAIDGDKIQSMTSKKAFLNVFKRSGNIYHEDFLTYDFKMKFDLVIGNPPYNVGGDNSYYVKFIAKSKEILKEGGVFSLIVPNRFLDPDSKCAKSMKGWLRVTKIYPNVNHHFPGIGTNIAAFVGTKEVGATFGVCDYVFDREDTTIQWNMNKPMPIQATSLIGAKILDKVFSFSDRKLVGSTTQPSNNFVYVDSAYVRYCHTKPRGGKKTVIARVNETNHWIIKNGKGVYYGMDTIDDANLNAWFLSRSLLGRFCVYSFANAPQVSVRNISRFPLLSGVEMNDLSVYELFGITIEEQNHINNVMVNVKEIS